MSDADIDVEGVEEAAAFIAVKLDEPLRNLCMAIAVEAQDRIAPYPGARRRAQAQYWSAKQRRGFFARLRRGQIKVPYRRSGDTLGRWKPEPRGDGAVLRNTSPHAKWTHNSQTQAAYHTGNWKTEEGVVTEIERDGTVGRMAEDMLRKVFQSND